MVASLFNNQKPAKELMMLRRTALLLLFMLITLTAMAQSANEKELAETIEQFRAAMIAGDTAALNTLTMSELSYGHSGGAVQDKAAFIDALATGKSDFVTLEFSAQTIHISGNTAVVRHTLTASTNDNGKPGNTRLGVLLIWQKDKKHWKLLARQAVKLPV